MNITINPSAGQKALNIKDRVKSYEDACQVLGITSPINLEFPDELNEEAEKTQAFIKLIIIAKALNEGWKPDWNDGDGRKYYPYFNMENGFSLNDVLDDYYRSLVSSRLCFKSEDLARYAATQFLELFKQLFVNP